METEKEILDLLQASTNQAVERTRRCVILQPGAIGDCILTLPLANFLKKNLKVGVVDMIAQIDYAGYFPGRTCIDSVRALNSINMHKLFSPHADFKLNDAAALIEVFAGFSYIISFMGSADSDFEKNLIFTVNCSNSAEIIILDQISDISRGEHISETHINNFRKQYDTGIDADKDILNNQLINLLPTDITAGREILNSYRVEEKKKLIVMHPGSGSIKKSWNLGNYLSLANTFQKQNKQVVFMLGPAEIERFSTAQIEAIKDTAAVISNASLNQILQVLCCCDCFIGNDSGVTHLAAALGIKTIAMFGATNPQTYRPVGPYVTVIKDDSQAFALSPSEEIQKKAIEVIES